MRRSVILLLLLGAMELLRPLGSAGYGAQALLSFGFLILAAHTVGELAHASRVPKIVGYLVAGMIFGPSLLHVIGAEAIDRLEPVSDLAIALIAFLAGAELQWSEVRRRGVTFLKIMTVELAVCFAAIVALLYGMRGFVPFLATASDARVLAFCLLFASVAIVHSPAVTMALLSETRARGPVARTTLGVVLLTDVAVVLLFSGMLAIARAIAPPDDGGAALSLGMVIWEIGGALLVGVVLGAVVTGYLRFVGQELTFVAIIIALLGAEVASLLHVETLLTLITAGFVAENASRDGRGEALRHAMERSAAPIFVVFFAISGANIDLRGVGALVVLALPVVAVRLAAIWGGTRIGTWWAGMPKEEGRHVWMGLVSQAGVAIGLATVAAEAYPVLGEALRTLLLAVMAINQLFGPIFFRRALAASGEVTEEGADPAGRAPEPAPS
jgi:Kef-type K+ transport system membrane component KefB